MLPILIILAVSFLILRAKLPQRCLSIEAWRLEVHHGVIGMEEAGLSCSYCAAQATKFN
jgi:hypothetical protein